MLKSNIRTAIVEAKVDVTSLDLTETLLVRSSAKPIKNIGIAQPKIANVYFENSGFENVLKISPIKIPNTTPRPPILGTGSL